MRHWDAGPPGNWHSLGRRGTVRPGREQELGSGGPSEAWPGCWQPEHLCQGSCSWASGLSSVPWRATRSGVANVLYLLPFPLSPSWILAQPGDSL